ncbi:maltose ABC transporter periplasmic protein [Symmachiella dynata]|uniref:extracellular solute-binding protein n=2 Tax=Symmachiella dynata TaxID=2527995 RepID=UPI0011897D8C|nr:extracellular solute-binding protein [Symmachiella dynata]QDT47012.1 maltose ABC transporter periplasmic protein [Symmachiella dynata]
MRDRIGPILLATIAVSLFGLSWAVGMRSTESDIPPDRERVVFWHFWGGKYRHVVQDVVQRFNDSQTEFWVEEIAVPGQNLDMKFFMALAGGDFPDVLNQDDQIIGQWAQRGALTPLDQLMPAEEYARLNDWLSPPAQKIGTYDGRLYALCNGLDIRLMFYRRDILAGRNVPTTLEEFNAITRQPSDDPTRIVYLPDDRRLWAWGIAFGGRFYDPDTGKITANDPAIVRALEWMVSYSQLHGLEKIRAFRSTNRETGSQSMLLEGSHGVMMDGQWRIEPLDAAVSDDFDYAVGPLPHPPEGNPNGGWVNGNFFLVPRGCKNPRGAWAFMKFWSGFDGHETEAAQTAAAGGWIPASPNVVTQPTFQTFLNKHPNFRLFVEQAHSPNQWPTPNIPVQAYFFERINQATEEALALKASPQQALDTATQDIQRRLDALRANTNQPQAK